MAFSPLITELVEALKCLPGVGPKSAQRMAFYLLEHNRRGGQTLAYALERAMASVQNCQRCRILSEQTLCPLCTNSQRQAHILCIVESPADVLAIEQAGAFRGLYFVLSGHLSPIEGIGPEDIGLDALAVRLAEEPIREVVLATNPTVEGEATAYFIAEMVKPYPIKVTRIAHGVPLGGELEYVDAGTLAKALADRAPV